VDGCIEAAGSEVSPAFQRRLLEVSPTRLSCCTLAVEPASPSHLIQTKPKAAEFGKGFTEGIRTDRLVEMCKALHVINNVRIPSIGMPLTYFQFVPSLTPLDDSSVLTTYEQNAHKRYDILGPDALIERLVNRHLHALAYAIADFLKLKRDKILIHWACRKVSARFFLPKRYDKHDVPFASLHRFEQRHRKRKYWSRWCPSWSECQASPTQTWPLLLSAPAAQSSPHAYSFPPFVYFIPSSR